MKLMFSFVCIGYAEVVKTFLDNGVNVDFKDTLEKTSLHNAAELGNEDLVHLFLERGANINAKDFSDRTPLILAATEVHLNIVQILLEKGATIDSEDRDMVAQELQEQNESEDPGDSQKVEGIF